MSCKESCIKKITTNQDVVYTSQTFDLSTKETKTYSVEELIKLYLDQKANTLILLCFSMLLSL